MAPANRIGAVVGRKTPQIISARSYTCLQCRLDAYRASGKHNPSSNYLPSRRHASGINVEKWRKKIWGSETPPGAADPYGSPSVLDQRRMEQRPGDQKEELGAPERAELSGTTAEGNEDGDYDDGYRPSSTWDGLPRVGGASWGKEDFLAEHPFEGFMFTKLGRQEDIVTAVYQALVEVFTLKQANLPLVMDADPKCQYHPNVYVRWLVDQSSFEQDEKGQTQLVLGSEDLQQVILDTILPREYTEEDIREAQTIEQDQYSTNQEDAEEMAQQEAEDAVRLNGSSDTVKPKESTEGEAMEAGVLGPDQYPSAGKDEAVKFQQEAEDADTVNSSAPVIERQDIKSESPERIDTYKNFPEYESVDDSYTGSTVPPDNGWRNVSFDDQEVKFAVLKRVMQLTGTRIPDPAIAGITNSKILLTHMVKRPKPRKLAEKLFTKELAELPNVQISKRKYGLIDKEKEIGRWKVIEQELARRGLRPISGRGVGRQITKLNA